MTDRGSLVDALASAGCVAPDEEATLLLAAARAGAGPIDDLLVRRTRGEPVAWITGGITFCDLRVGVASGVFVPRRHTEALARRAADLLPLGGTAVDLCTGSGAVAVVLADADPTARIVATDVDPVAVACARDNGVDARLGDLDDALPPALRGTVDLVTAVAPYVPTEWLPFLPRDVLAFEPRAALDGGPSGTDVLARAAAAAARLLRPGGSLLLEIGGDQAEAIVPTLAGLGFDAVRIHADEDGHDRAVEARSLRAGRC